MQALRIEVSTVTSGKQSAKKVKESRSLLHFFFLSFLHSYDTLGTNREYLQFEFLRDLIPCYQDYYLFFFFFIALEMYETYCIVYNDLRYSWIIRSNVNF